MKIKFVISIVAVIVLLISACYQNSSAISKYNLQRPDSLKSINPELAPIVVQAFLDLKVPGAIVGVFIGGYEPWVEAMGLQNLEIKQPMVLYNKMRIGSITKTFTGTVLLQLVDEGKINLSDKLSKYFPDYPNGDNITIQELGDMRSGLFNYSDDGSLVNDIMTNLKKSYTPEELISISQKHKPYFPPDSSFHYSNTNTIILGLIIEKLTGNSLKTEIQNRILTPLGMNETTFATDTYFPDPHAQGYMYLDSNSTETTNVTDQNPSWAWSAGAIISTLADLQLYAKKLAKGELISKKSQEDRLKWATSIIVPTGVWNGKEVKYGFAIGSFDGAIGHNGGIPGYNSFMGYLPEKDATIIVLVNMQDNKEGIGPADHIARKIIEKLNEM